MLLTSRGTPEWFSRGFAIVFCGAAILVGTSASRHLTAGQGPEPFYDLLIVHGHIIDGSGSPWFEGSVAVKDGKIADVGRLENATRCSGGCE